MKDVNFATPLPALVEQWRTPRPVSDVTLAFPARVIGSYMPTWEELPEQFQQRASGYESLASHVCFYAVELRPETLIEGIDANAASRHLCTVSRSFEPKHEHKEAALAFLLSLWLKPECLDD